MFLRQFQWINHKSMFRIIKANLPAYRYFFFSLCIFLFKIYGKNQKALPFQLKIQFILYFIKLLYRFKFSHQQPEQPLLTHKLPVSFNFRLLNTGKMRQGLTCKVYFVFPHFLHRVNFSCQLSQPLYRHIDPVHTHGNNHTSKP